MNIIYTFDDEKEGDMEKADLMRKASSLAGALSSILAEFRLRLKHHEMTDKEIEIYEEIRDFVLEHIEEHGIKELV